MTGLELLRAFLVGASTVFVVEGWRGWAFAACLIVAFLCTDWIHEDRRRKQAVR
jgi:hypothetical protein